MQTPLRIILFFVLVTSVASLECETCSSTGVTCTGTKQICTTEQTTCAIALIESTLDGPSVTSIEKSCATPSKCTTPPVYLSLGFGKHFRKSFACCTENCTTVIPDLPPVQVRANGRQCPACISVTPKCDLQMVNCTGSETDCFELTAHIEMNGTHVDRVVKGCTTRYVCATIQKEKENLFSTDSTIDKAGCTTGPFAGAPRPSGNLLPTLFGFLLPLIFL